MMRGAVLGVVLALVMAGVGAGVSGGIYRCEVDGISTFGESPCVTAPLATVDGERNAERQAQQRAGREECQRRARFAREVADSRAVGVAQSVVEGATRAANPELIAVVLRLYCVPPNGVANEVAAIERECLKEIAWTLKQETPE